ncbi:3-phosphoserine/phosphohydroxythreonine aminotransferase [Clostridia bacterium]|nr:3-phosphoserine/phosphohydroxythreonine aminotransferase [Clostridia bacterium]
MRVYNFSAGPACLPESVLKTAAAELVEYGNSGQSVMEMSHRSKEYDAIIKGTEALFREVLSIPDNYEVLFLQGGASLQFAMVPLNLKKNGKADFVVTGQWATKAYKEASRFLKANVVASSKDKTFSYIPDLDSSAFTKDADYFHICVNNTIYGTRFATLPETGDVPLVGDASSCILSEPLDVSRFGVLYAGAQKNMGPAGLTAVIVRKDLIRDLDSENVPTMLQYKTHADNESMFNTPPTYAVYVFGLVLKWVKEQGGLPAMKIINDRKAKALYDFLDGSAMFSATVTGDSRSVMNIPFVTGNDELDAKFVKEAKAAGFVNLKGHRSVGGMRASIYNAMPEAGVAALIDFMRGFEKANG